jgi:hypothetical protein
LTKRVRSSPESLFLIHSKVFISSKENTTQLSELCNLVKVKLCEN